MALNKELSDYVSALSLIHEPDSFWVFDGLWELVYSNNERYDLKELQLYSYDQDKTLSVEVAIKLLKHYPNLAVHRESTETIAFYTHGDDTSVLLFESVPLLNESGVILGYFVLCHGSMSAFEHLNLLRNVLFGNKSSPVVHKELSQRELEIVFFIIRGKNYREIARVLSKVYKRKISYSTIGNIVRNSLYAKFNVFNKIALKKALLQSEVCVRLPKSLFSYIE